MNELYFTKNNRETIQVVRIEYGQLVEGYVLKHLKVERILMGYFYTSLFFQEKKCLMMNN